MSRLAGIPPGAPGIPYAEWMRRHGVEREPLTREDLIAEIFALVDRGKVAFAVAHGYLWADQQGEYLSVRHWDLVRASEDLARQLVERTERRKRCRK